MEKINSNGIFYIAGNLKIRVYFWSKVFQNFSGHFFVNEEKNLSFFE